MTTGPARQPDELKILNGTFRADRDGDPKTSVVATGIAENPSRLKGEALRFWREVVPGLIERGLAKTADESELAAMCEWHARYVKAGKALDRCSMTGKGSGKMSQLLYAAGIAWDKFDRIACRFGLTPSDRAKLRVETKQPGASKVLSRKRG